MQSHLLAMIQSQSIYTAKKPDQPKHQPRFKKNVAPVVWRGGVRYHVVAGKLIEF